MTIDWDAWRHLNEQVEKDDERVGFVPPMIETKEGGRELKVAWVVARHPFLGGEFYRATRPAMLASEQFGWHTAVCDRMATDEEDPDGKLAFLTPGPNPHVIVPDIIVLRPIREWTREFSDQAQRNGQVVIADLDDDVWSHEDWTPDDRPNDDGFEDWCYSVDGWLCSTDTIRARILERYVANKIPPVPVLVAPNCFDFEIFRHGHGGPRPGRRIGTRLWLSGRMSGDLELYGSLFAPLLAALDLQFVHIGHEVGSERSFVHNCHMAPDRVVPISSVPIPEMGRWLASTVSIGVICLSDHPYNRAKTLTHAVELASVGLPLVIADGLGLYKDVPGQVRPEIDAVERRLRRLVNDRQYWARQSLASSSWAQTVAESSTVEHLQSLRMLVEDRCVHIGARA